MRNIFLVLSLILAPAALAQPGTTNWMFSTGDGIYSSPAIGHDGTIYVASYDYKIYALRPDGTKRWEFDLNQRPPTFPQMWSSPAIGSDGTIYFGSGDTHVYALTTNGTVRWKFPTGDIVWSDVAIGPDQTIYAGGYDTNLYALYPSNTVRWLFQPGAGIFADPILAPNSVVYFGADDGKLYAVGATGTKLWEFQGGHGTTASPAVDTDGTIYFSSTQGAAGQRLYAVWPDGSLKWDYLTGGNVASSPAIGPDGTIYVGSNDQKLHAIDPQGTSKWAALTGGTVRSSPAVAADGTIYVGSDDGFLYAFNSEGSNLWSAATGGAVHSSPVIGADGTVYVGSAEGSLYAFEGTAGLANTPWPMFRGNPQHTGRSAQEPANYPPFLDPLTNITVQEDQAISFACKALDPNKDILSFSLDAPLPNGAQINSSSGLFSWTPGETDGATTNTITVRVTDQGSPERSVTRTFTVVVEEVNSPPVFEPLADSAINEGELVQLNFAVQDPDQPEQNISFSLVDGPSLAVLNSQTGQFTWTPSEQDGPDTVILVVVAMDDGTPSRSATQQVTLTVTEHNQAPTLEDIPDQTLQPSESLDLTAQASDPDLPSNVFSFSLSEHPPGATINSGTGQIVWSPSTSGTNMFTVLVTDNASPALTDTTSFLVIVTGRLVITSIRVQDGNVRIRWDASPGKNYRVLGKTDLQASEWTGLSGLVPVGGSVGEWTGLVQGIKQFLKVEQAP